MSRPSLEGVNFSLETEMQVTAIFIAIFAGLFIAIFFSLILSGKEWTAAQARSRARRIADARMNARLLRLNV